MPDTAPAQFNQAMRREMDALLTKDLADIKDELKAVRGLLERMVRVEEKISNTAVENERLRGELTAIYGRISKLETAHAAGGSSLQWIERGVWAIVAATLGWFFSGGHK